MNDEWLAKIRELVGDSTNGPILHRLLQAEVTKIVDAMHDESLDPSAEFSDEEFGRRLTTYEALSADLASAAALVGYWGASTDPRLNPGLIARIANAPERTAGQVPYLSLQLYPAVLVLYAAGLASVLGSREEQLGALLAPVAIREGQEWKPVALALSAAAAIDHRVAQRLPGLERRHTPASDRLVEVTRPWLAEFESGALAFERAFDRWEYLLGLVAFDLSRQGRTGGWAPVGRFSWRGNYGNGIDETVVEEIKAADASWPLLRGGLFAGDPARLQESAAEWQAFIGGARRSQL
jgi:hypothetical protein